MSSIPHPALGPLHAVHVLSTVAGAHVSSLAGGLVARGVEVTVCGPAAADGDYGFTRAGARFRPVELGRRPAADAPAVGALRAVFTSPGWCTRTDCGPGCSPPSRWVVAGPRWWSPGTAPTHPPTPRRTAA
ncbi:hypothetical protein [Streptomyces sp. SID4948]|uniref:hypothetical protein n=1 Tax=Streptomyces sp. SID4948 TaxID=2690287 RepID=UPI0031FD6F9D